MSSLNGNKPSRGGTHISTAPQAASVSPGPQIPRDMAAFQKTPSCRWCNSMGSSQFPQVGCDSVYEKISNKYHSRTAFLHSGTSHTCWSFPDEGQPRYCHEALVFSFFSRNIFLEDYVEVLSPLAIVGASHHNAHSASSSLIFCGLLQLQIAWG